MPHSFILCRANALPFDGKKASTFHLLNKAGTRHFVQTETINYDLGIWGSHGWNILPCTENDQWRLLQLLAKTS